MKACSRCKQEKDNSEFYVSRNRRDGLSNECRECAKSRVLEQYRSRPEDYIKHTREIWPNGYKRCTKCGEILPFSMFVKSSTGRFGLRSYCRNCAGLMFKSWAERNYEPYHDKIREHYHKNKDIMYEKFKAWLKTESGNKKHKLIVQRRRANKINSTENPITQEQWDKTVLKFEGKCAYCDGVPTSQDHFMPLSRGGKHEFGNIVPACKSCNSRKHNKNPIKWIEKNFGTDRLYKILFKLSELGVEL